MTDAITIRCGACGHLDAFEAFTRTPITGELPRDTYQCPGCGVAIRRKPVGRVQIAPGLTAPERVELVPAQPVF